MVVENSRKESGQSIIEFLLMFPLIVGMIVTLVKVNTAAQISIVNQQYARAQALFLTYNSPYYPNLAMVDRAFVGSGINANQMVIFVGEENTEDFGDGADEVTTPTAPGYTIVQNAARNRGAPINQIGGATNKGRVRVLSSVSLCTQSATVNTGGITPAANMTENTDYRFCAYPFIENGGKK